MQSQIGTKSPNKAIELTGDSACFFAIPKSFPCHPPLIAAVRQHTCIIVSCSLACVSMDFEIIGEISGIEIIARGSSVRDRARLRRQYGRGRWRKLKGVAHVRLVDRTIRLAEIHWYEAHGIGQRECKLKLPFLDA